MGNEKYDLGDPLVSIAVLAYKHENYISTCLDGILMQKTNFNFEIVIGEDYSPDDTKKICEQYAGKYSFINLLPTQQNLGMIPNTMRVYRACKGKYIAVCEGDDYWTDPNKLQKQVDFLETHPDYGLVHSDFDKLYEKSGRIIHNFNKNNNIYNSLNVNIFHNLLTYRYEISTLTVLAKREFIFKAINTIDMSGYLMTDLPTWLALSQMTKFHYIDESMGVYRKIRGSVSNDPSNYRPFITSGLRIRLDFAERFETPIDIKHKLQKDYLRSLLLQAFYSQDKQLSKKYYTDMTEHNLNLSLLDWLIFQSIENKLLHLFLMSIDKIKMFIIVILKSIVKKNL